MIVGFWSYAPGKCNVTSTALAVSSYVASALSRDCALLQFNNSLDNGIHTSFIDMSSRSLESIANRGMDPLLRLVKSSDADLRSYLSCGFSFIDKNLTMYVPSLADDAAGYYNTLYAQCSELFRTMRMVTRVTFVDLGSGRGFTPSSDRDGLSIEAMKQMECIVVCLPQNINSIRYYFSNYEIKSKNVLYVITDFDENRGTSLKAIMKASGGKLTSANCVVLHHSAEFADACDNSTLPRFAEANIAPTATAPTYKFFKDCELIFKKLNKMKGNRNE